MLPHHPVGSTSTSIQNTCSFGTTPRKRYRLPLSPTKKWQSSTTTSSSFALNCQQLEEELPKISPDDDNNDNSNDNNYDNSYDDDDVITYPSSFESDDRLLLPGVSDIEEDDTHPMMDSATITTTLLFQNQTQKIAINDNDDWWTNLSANMPGDSILWLNVVAIIWGSQHAVVKTCVEDLDPSSFSLVRFSLGAMIATPAWWLSSNSNSNSNHQSHKQTNDNYDVDDTTTKASPNKASTDVSTNNHDAGDLITTWRWGTEMGLWMFLGYAFQAVGLAYTTAQRSGFLLYLNVKLVPFFAFVLLGRKISLPTWVSAFTALLGTSLIAYDGTSLALNTGDLWSLAAAAASAMFILRLEAASSAVSNAAALNASCLWVVTLASLIWSASLGLVTVQNLIDTLTAHPLELLYLSAVTTALANWIQTKAQKNVTAERASVIYAMDPVWGAIWSNLLLGETLSGFGVIGAGLITIAAATNAFLDLGAKEDGDSGGGGGGGGSSSGSAEKA